MTMKIVVITGSPHKKGTSALLADEFIRGAKEAGHEVSRFDAAFENVHPCIGCNKCEYGKKLRFSGCYEQAESNVFGFRCDCICHTDLLLEFSCSVKNSD